MSGPSEHRGAAGGESFRIWEMGSGEPLVFLGGAFGLPRWPGVLDRLATRRRVLAPSLPGFFGAAGHDRLDDTADWIAATLDCIDACEEGACDLVGASIGGALAAEVAAFSPAKVKRLVLIAPFGLCDDAEPVVDVFAKPLSEMKDLLSSQPEALAAFLARQDDTEESEWQGLLARANEAATQLLGAGGKDRLHRRLHRIQAPTLLVWGSDDRVVPPSYARRFASEISGWVETASIEGAAHMAEIDRPEAVADVILRFTD